MRGSPDLVLTDGPTFPGLTSPGGENSYVCKKKRYKFMLKQTFSGSSDLFRAGTQPALRFWSTDHSIGPFWTILGHFGPQYLENQIFPDLEIFRHGSSHYSLPILRFWTKSLA